VGVVAAAFAFTLVGGVVYAATTGVLNINGTVVRGANVDLDFVNASCSVVETTDVPAGDGFAVVAGAIEDGDNNCAVVVRNNTGTNGANDRLEFGVYLRTPGDTVTINFDVENVGSVNASLAAINTTGTTGFGGVTGITLGGSITTDFAAARTINVGGSESHTITVTWPTTGAAAASSDSATFVAELQYTAAP
jgi:hypothetical protein